MKKELLFILFGWLLGLLSPLIVDFFRERKLRKDFGTSAKTELQDLQFILASMVFLLELKYGRVTVELVELVSDVIDGYEGNESIEFSREILTGLRGKSQEQLDEIIANMPDNQRTGFSLKLIKPNYVLSNLGELSKLPPEVQLQYFELLRTFSTLNQEVPKIDRMMHMTFDSSISEENHQTIHDDIRSRYVFFADQCKLAVKKIENIIGHA